MRLQIEDNGGPMQGFLFRSQVVTPFTVILSSSKKGPWWKLGRREPVDYELYKINLEAGDVLEYAPTVGFFVMKRGSV